MAVVINGSGTVTGLAVGGLPDGTVDEGTLAADSVTAAKIPAALENTFVSGRKNLIINGAMQVAQRGTSFTATGSDTDIVDRFFARANTTNINVAQQSNTISLISSKYMIQFTGAASNTGLYLGQRIEAKNTAHLEDKSITISFYIKNDSGATINPNLNIYRPTTTDDTFSALTQLQSSVNTGDITNGTEVRVSHTYDLTGDDLSKGVQVWVQLSSAFTSGTINITGVQLELGSTATDFEHRSYGEELALCQRYYYQDIRGIAQEVGVAWYYTSNHVSWIVNFPVPMRAQPTMDYSGPTNGWTIYRNGAADTLTSMVMENVNLQNNRASMYNSTQVSGTAGQTGILRATHSNCLLSFSAEL